MSYLRKFADFVMSKNSDCMMHIVSELEISLFLLPKCTSLLCMYYIGFGLWIVLEA